MSNSTPTRFDTRLSDQEACIAVAKTTYENLESVAIGLRAGVATERKFAGATA